MFSYYGSKSKLVNLYPEPLHDTIIEPFAGSARYSLKYWDKDIYLIEKDITLIKVWKYLQNVSPKELDSLPRVKFGDNIKDFNLSEEELLFMSFIVNEGNTGKRYTVTKRAAPKVDYKIKTTKDILPRIKHWKIIHGDYTDAPDICATWFVDPPYVNGGQYYRFSNIDYNFLSSWCLNRKGQLIVCEGKGANWLPFIDLKEYWGGIKHGTERVFIRNE